MDPGVGVVGVVSSFSEERGLPGPCGPRWLVELRLVWVHSDLMACSTQI